MFQDQKEEKCSLSQVKVRFWGFQLEVPPRGYNNTNFFFKNEYVRIALEKQRGNARVLEAIEIMRSLHTPLPVLLQKNNNSCSDFN